MHTDQIREKTSLPISSDETSPIPTDLNATKLLDPKLSVWTN